VNAAYYDTYPAIFAGSGFCMCDEENGFYMDMTDPYGTPVANADSVDSPCVPACFIKNKQGTAPDMDECYGTSNADHYANNAALDADREGCMQSTTTGFCVCDEDNGWYMPDSDADGEPDSAYDGECLPACYKPG